ncbi:hypothetical protein ATE48_07750 [Candidatus Viadribacter manganicus]|uniref:Uncharacterized protein n=1 Tax=Candidatus Viadribacter manganicus TaxID=1759059 RepID=A0A1B1AH00_9PROT|nr:hypothetical protein ATE48_07750 [Candidatus Viadribacter manganicus]
MRARLWRGLAMRAADDLLQRFERACVEWGRRHSPERAKDFCLGQLSIADRDLLFEILSLMNRIERRR